ncbi:MAG: UDP-N-acetylmuramoyl-tripeptide--D-alanyl-D-alanine ligase [Bacteroidota bacterium]
MKGPELFLLFQKYPSICTDTRKLKEGDLFFALRGERFDGNVYAEKALDAGASRAIIDDSRYAKKGDKRYILVENVLTSLQELARLYRRSLSIPVLGITGSNGKTTSKELTYAALQAEKKVFATQGNLNNHIGVPLSLLSIPPDAEIAIIEMGTNQPGDIQELVEIAEPDHGLITNIGSAHLERLGSIGGIREEKGALFRWVMKEGGRIFLNQADPELLKLIADYKNLTTYGREDSDYLLEIKQNNAKGIEMEVVNKNWEQKEVFRLNLSGSYNALNALVAIAVAQFFDVSLAGIKAGLSSYVSSNNRSQIMEREGYQIYLDAYNANPSSMKASIANIFELGKKKVCLILGDMFELGKEEEQMHAELGRFVKTFSPYMCIGIGKLMAFMLAEIEGKKAGFPDAASAKEHIVELIEGADMVMIKGSRGMALESLLEKI